MRSVTRRVERLEQLINGSNCVCGGFDITDVDDDDPRAPGTIPLPHVRMCPQHGVARGVLRAVIDCRWVRRDGWASMTGAATHA